MNDKGYVNDKWAVFFATVIVYAYPLYYNLFSIFGIQRPYWALPVYAAILLFCTLVMFCLDCGENHFRITKRQGWVLLLIFAIFISYFLTNSRYGVNDIASDTIEDFLARGVPAVLIAMVAAKKVSINSISKGMGIIHIIFTICSSKIIWISILNGYSTSKWESLFSYDYQSASYMAAYAVGIGLYKLFIEYKGNSIWRRMFYLYSIITCTILSVYSGGRGGVVLCAVYVILLCLYFIFIEKKAIKFLSFVVVLMISFVIMFNFLFDNSQLLSGFTRAFEFVGAGGINWEGTSGRQSIYQNCLNLISEHPFLGYGITGAPRNGIERSHNIILDILIDGGIVYLVIWIMLWVIFFKHCLSKMKTNSCYALLVVFFIDDFIMLNFSGVYMRTSAMWFAVVYAFVEAGLLQKGETEYEYINAD